ncbi:uncharacterized protein ISCGN_005313 [Ixodes scapularis]
MTQSCVAVNCTERYRESSGVSFHKFPADSKRRRRWIISVDRKQWSPRANDRLCGKRFLEGKCGFNFDRPEACSCAEKPSSDRDHWDFVPTVFAHKAPALPSACRWLATSVGSTALQVMALPATRYFFL